MKGSRSLMVIKGAIMFLWLQPYWASAEPGVNEASRQFPSVAPESCGYQIRHPEGASTAYVSRDCKTVFVLPPTAGKLTFSSFRPNMNLTYCGSLQVEADIVANLTREIRRVTKISEQIDPRDPDYKNVLGNIATLQKLKSDLVKSSIFTTLEGGSLHMRLDSQFDQRIIDQYVVNNVDAIRNHQVIFAQTPISRGFLSFKVVNRSDKDDFARGVLEYDFAGIRKKADEQGTVDHVMMGSGLSGQMRLTLQGSCPFVQHQYLSAKDPTKVRINVNDIEINQERLEGDFSASYTYEVPLLSSIGYEAKLGTDSTLKVLAKTAETKGQFTLTSFSDQVVSGGASSALEFTVTAYEMPEGWLTPEDKAGFMASLRQGVSDRLTARLLGQLADLQLLEKMEPEKLAAPAGGTVNEDHTRRVCNSNKFLGITISSHCEDQRYSLPRWVDGHFDQLVQKINDVKFVVQETVLLNDVIKRYHSSGFKLEFTK